MKISDESGTSRCNDRAARIRISGASHKLGVRPAADTEPKEQSDKKIRHVFKY